MKITVDMDGVMADFVGHVLNLYETWYGVRPIEPDKVYGPINDYLHFSSNSQFWKWVDSIPDFWLSMPPIPGALGAFREMRRDPNYRLQIVTARHGIKAGAQTRQWFQHHMGLNLTLHTFQGNETVTGKSADILTGVRGDMKFMVPTDLHIDDHVKVLQHFPRKNSLLFYQPWSYSGFNAEEFLDLPVVAEASPAGCWGSIRERFC